MDYIIYVSWQNDEKLVASDLYFFLFWIRIRKMFKQHFE